MIFYRTGRIQNNIDARRQSVEVMNVRRPVCSALLARDGFTIHREAVQTAILKRNRIEFLRPERNKAAGDGATM